MTFYLCNCLQYFCNLSWSLTNAVTNPGASSRNDQLN